MQKYANFQKIIAFSNRGDKSSSRWTPFLAQLVIITKINISTQLSEDDLDVIKNMFDVKLDYSLFLIFISIESFMFNIVNKFLKK